MAKILYAEDSLPQSMACTNILARRGHDVTTVNDGSSAVEALRARQFDVLLIDGDMPGANGFEIINVAQKVEQPPKVIILYTAAKVFRVLPGVIVLNKLTDSVSVVCRRIHEALGIAIHPMDEEKE